MSSVAPAAAVETSEQPQAAPRFAKRLLRRPSARVCVGYLGLLVGIAIIAPIVLPGIATQDAGNLAAEFQGPSAQHLLGTDSVGRDVLERLLVGTRPTLVAVAEAVIVALVIGVTAGVATGFMRAGSTRPRGGSPTWRSRCRAWSSCSWCSPCSRRTCPRPWSPSAC